MASLLSASALVAMALASLDTADTDTDSPPSNQTTRPFFAKPFLLGAHRGGKALWPENTLLAFTQAAAQWPDILLEGDARVTADGEVVLIHDGKIDRTTNGAGPISSMTLAEVKAFDAGYRFSRDGGKTFPYRGKGLTIPTFAEVLAALPDSRFLIELKGQTGVAESIVPVLRETGAVDRVALASHFAPLMQRARKLEPALIACYDVVNGMDMLTHLRGRNWEAYRPLADILAIDRDMVVGFNLGQPEFRALRAKGIAVSVHTVNDAEEMRSLIDLGVSCILTDKPDVLAQIVK